MGLEGDDVDVRYYVMSEVVSGVYVVDMYVFS
jgi:hypothetical protein